MQKRRTCISIALAKELRLFCIKKLIWNPPLPLVNALPYDTGPVFTKSRVGVVGHTSFVVNIWSTYNVAASPFKACFDSQPVVLNNQVSSSVKMDYQKTKNFKISMLIELRKL